MPLPSLYASRNRPWNVGRAAGYGAGIGALAALIRTFEPAHAVNAAPAPLLEIAGAAFGFALLCAGAAALRNILARRLIWSQTE
jgi:hypothetical protein